MLPLLSGDPIRVQIRRSLGPHLAATHIPKRLILLDREVFARPGDFERILIHEIFHFAWVRLGNPLRLDWERLLESEFHRRASGELGWSSQWRKEKLSSSVIKKRAGAWRRYACESFCDSAAWMYSSFDTHDEFTLPAKFRRRRAQWFGRNFGPNMVRI